MAPEGPKIIAHGFSGKDAKTRGALEGRYKRLCPSPVGAGLVTDIMSVVSSLKLYRPFRGFEEMIAAYPRLKPWAIISRPLRGETPRAATVVAALGLDPSSRTASPQPEQM